MSNANGDGNVSLDEIEVMAQAQGEGVNTNCRFLPQLGGCYYTNYNGCVCYFGC